MARFWRQLAKRSLKRTLARHGYAVRSVNYLGTITGMDLVEDVVSLLARRDDVVVFDVGANTGQSIEEFLAAFRSPRIFSFEPSPATFETLFQTYGQDTRVQLENLALGDREGVLSFHVTRDYSVNDSLLTPTWEQDSTEISVCVSTVDRYCDDHQIGTVDFLKVDTQGYDLNVLRGASRRLSQGQIRFLSVEVIFTPMYVGQPALMDFVSFLESFKYRLVGFYEQTYVKNRLNHLNACFEYGGR